MAKTDPLAAKAAQYVDAELNPQLNALARQLAAAQKDAAKRTADTKATGARAQSDLGQIYDRLKGFLGYTQQTQDRSSDQTAKVVGSNYSNLGGQIGSIYDKAQSQTNNEMARLGITQGNNRMAEDRAFLLGLNNTDAGNAKANLGAQKTSFDALMAQMTGAAGAEGAMQKGQFSRDNLKALQDIAAQLSATSTEIRGRQSDVQGQRGARLNQVLDSLRAQEAQARAAGAAAAASMARARAAGGGGGSGGGGMSYEDQLDVATKEAKLRALLNPKTDYKGREGAYAYLKAIAGNDAKKYTDLTNIFRGGETGQWREQQEKGAKYNFSPTDTLITNHLTKYSIPGRASDNWGKKELDALLQAIAIYNKK